MAEDAQRAWDRFLTALASGRPAELRAATTAEGDQWVTSWLNPEQAGFDDRCATLAAGWRGRLRVVEGTDVPVGERWVYPWTRAFWWFGPQILVRFETVGGELRVDQIGFWGD